MPSLYHFNSDQFKENLILGGQQHMVTGRLCQYLKGWQLDGIRFLYKHFEKGESCILNDESGLGKVVTTSVFLGAILNNDTTKKCLIIVRDDEYIEGWRFHLSVLTQLSVKVIERTSDISQETVFLIKWSTIKDIGQISKTTFDHIIVDNRGDMLTNKFCTGILLRYYENKISIVISSSDVTSDIKLLHTLLRLCGRLDKQYADVKLFEEKFQLPTVKEGVCNKIDLEDYFLKREKVINFCREFRLRRYCHQFDEKFPLVPCNDFKRYLQEWRNSINSQSSGSAKLCSSSSEKDVEELFEVYFRVKQERDDRDKKDCREEEQKPTECIVCDDNESNFSDELVVMSPLVFISESESENEKTHDEPVTLISDEIKEEDENQNEKTNITSEEGTMSSKADRRKLKKPVKKSTQSKAEVLSGTNLRSRKVVSGSRQSTKSDKNEKSDNIPRGRGRPPIKKCTQNTDSSKHPSKILLSSKDKSEIRKDSKDRRASKIDFELVKGEARKNTEAAVSKTKQNMETKDEDKKKRRNLLRAESTSEKGDKINKAKSNGVEKTTESTTNTKIGKKEDMVNKLVDKQQNVKTNEKKTFKTIESDHDGLQMDKSEGAKLLRRSRTKPEENSEGEVKVKKKKLADDWNKTKEVKEKENRKRHNKNKHDQEPHPEVISKKPTRHVPFDLVIEEANKFLKIKNTTAAESTNANSLIKAPRRTRLSEKSEEHDKSTSRSGGQVSKTKTPNSSKKSKASKECPSNGSNLEKERSTTPKRAKPLTVYTLLGVHSRSTRGMQRYTRSSSIQNKYMKVSEAQVGLDKLTKTKRPLIRRQSVSAEKAKSSLKDIKPDTPSVPETPTILESMQLGQALTPTNGCIAPEFTVPLPKKVGYDFPLMLDKDISDSECIITSNSNNKNEVIILTGSSTTDIESEMEPPKSTAIRRTSAMKPPMVSIPRQSKAKSPDLFSTCSDLSLPCSQQKSNKSTFDGFKIFGSEVRQNVNPTPIASGYRITQPQAVCNPLKNDSVLRKELETSPTNQPIEDEDAMFEITSNGTFSNIIHVNSNGEMSPVRTKNQSTPPSASHPKNRITNYLINNNQQTNGASPSPSLDEQLEQLQKTPKRRKSLSGTMKRSPRGINGAKTQSTKLTQWLIKNNPVVRISDKPLKPSSTKRRRLDLSFPDDK